MECSYICIMEERRVYPMEDYGKYFYLSFWKVDMSTPSLEIMESRPHVFFISQLLFPCPFTSSASITICICMFMSMASSLLK